VNVTSSILGDEFLDWIKERIEARNSKVAVEKDIMISVDPDIANAFNASTSISRKWLYQLTFLSFL
jgi:hypothetical protein